MVNRRTIPLAADARLRQVIMDTSAANFASEIAELARICRAQSEPVYAASCVGIGKGSQQMPRRSNDRGRIRGTCSRRVGSTAGNNVSALGRTIGQAHPEGQMYERELAICCIIPIKTDGGLYSCVISI
jgi:hypothetical protein